MQILNLAMGGGIDQHLEDPGAIHRNADFVSHRVRPVAGSLLASVTGSDEITVRSYHHQGLDPIAEGLTVSARSDDGLAEAAEIPGHSFCLAVLWHPEQDLAGGGQSLFDALAQATRDRLETPA